MTSTLAACVGRLAVGMVFAGVFLGSAMAHAAPTSKLTYVRGPGAEGCPAEPELRAAVARRVGYDPFFPYADRTVVAQIDHGATGFRAQIRVLDSTGVLLGERAIGAMSSCGELVQDLALTTERSEKPAAPNEALPRPETAQALRLRASLGGLTSVGSAPSPAVGVVLGAAARAGWWQIGMEGRFDAAASKDLEGGGNVSTTMLLASVVPCVLVRGRVTPYGCAVGSVGSLWAESEGVRLPARSAAAYGSLGGRVGIELALVGRLAAYLQVDGAASTTRHRVELDGATVFTVPPVSVAFGGGISALIF
jgi:hypothetical protein